MIVSDPNQRITYWSYMSGMCGVFIWQIRFLVYFKYSIICRRVWGIAPVGAKGLSNNRSLINFADHRKDFNFGWYHFGWSLGVASDNFQEFDQDLNSIYNFKEPPFKGLYQFDCHVRVSHRPGQNWSDSYVKKNILPNQHILDNGYCSNSFYI